MPNIRTSKQQGNLQEKKYRLCAPASHAMCRTTRVLQKFGACPCVMMKGVMLSSHAKRAQWLEGTAFEVISHAYHPSRFHALEIVFVQSAHGTLPKPALYGSAPINRRSRNSQRVAQRREHVLGTARLPEHGLKAGKTLQAIKT